MYVNTTTAAGGSCLNLRNLYTSEANKTIPINYWTTASNGTSFFNANIIYSSLDSDWNDSKFDFNIKSKPILTILGGTNNYVGINDTTPAYPLDVSGTVNISTGQTYKINGLDVLTSSSLGSSITSSSLTSVGTLTGLTVTGDVNIDSNTLKVDGTNNRVAINKATPTEALDVAGNTNLTTGSKYMINGTNVLTETSLGPSITDSSLTSVGTLNSLTLNTNAANNICPAGAVMHFAMITPPSGWLKCNGQEISRTTYSNLFTAVGTLWGAGDGSTTFNVPNLMGNFIRCLNDTASGTDANRTLSTTPQGFATQSHTHSAGYSRTAFATGSITAVSPVTTANVFTTGTNSGSTASETRPVNIALLACIKY
jgi:microcystin-dependent protein